MVCGLLPFKITAKTPWHVSSRQWCPGSDFKLFEFNDLGMQRGREEVTEHVFFPFIVVGMDVLCLQVEIKFSEAFMCFVSSVASFKKAAMMGFTSFILSQCLK